MPDLTIRVLWEEQGANLDAIADRASQRLRERASGGGGSSGPRRRRTAIDIIGEDPDEAERTMTAVQQRTLALRSRLAIAAGRASSIIPPRQVIGREAEAAGEEAGQALTTGFERTAGRALVAGGLRDLLRQSGLGFGLASGLGRVAGAAFAASPVGVAADVGIATVGYQAARTYGINQALRELQSTAAFRLEAGGTARVEAAARNFSSIPFLSPITPGGFIAGAAAGAGIGLDPADVRLARIARLRNKQPADIAGEISQEVEGLPFNEARGFANRILAARSRGLEGRGTGILSRLEDPLNEREFTEQRRGAIEANNIRREISLIPIEREKIVSLSKQERDYTIQTSETLAKQPSVLNAIRTSAAGALAASQAGEARDPARRAELEVKASKDALDAQLERFHGEEAAAKSALQVQQQYTAIILPARLARNPLTAPGSPAYIAAINQAQLEEKALQNALERAGVETSLFEKQSVGIQTGRERIINSQKDFDLLVERIELQNQLNSVNAAGGTIAERLTATTKNLTNEYNQGLITEQRLNTEKDLAYKTSTFQQNQANIALIGAGATTARSLITGAAGLPGATFGQRTAAGRADIALTRAELEEQLKFATGDQAPFIRERQRALQGRSALAEAGAAISIGEQARSGQNPLLAETAALRRQAQDLRRGQNLANVIGRNAERGYNDPLTQQAAQNLTGRGSGTGGIDKLNTNADAAANALQRLSQALNNLPSNAGGLVTNNIVNVSLTPGGIVFG